MRVLFYIFAVSGLLGFPVFAADRVQGPIYAEVLRVVDGDTLAVRALIWPGHRVEVKVRLARINAPELYRPACEKERDLARIATQFVQTKIDETNARNVELQNVRFGKYAGRVVADIRLLAGEDLGDLLLAAGLAHGQKDRSGWCDFVN
ncbi:MAG: nuclease [Robiginitomaculum sp.]|nr:MAG: nuclease [Robiginitomaculum sp.]